MNNNNEKSKIIEVYTDANSVRACIAIEKPDTRTEKERKFELIVIENVTDNLFEADAVRLALNYVPENSHVRLYCDKEGDLRAIKTGIARRPNLKAIINSIKSIEKERNLKIDYQHIPRKKNFAGRILDKMKFSNGNTTSL